MDDFGETSVAPHARSLSDATGTPLRGLCRKMVLPRFGPNGCRIVFTAQQVMTVHFADTAISGVFADLGYDGTLHLLADDGTTHHISTGDVELMGQV